MSEAVITLIAAVIATVIGIGSFFHYFLMALRWPSATGTVVGNVADRRSSRYRQYAYFPRIEFRAANGRSYIIKGDIGRNAEWPLGQRVRLQYRPAEPSHATIARGWQRFLFSAAFMGFAVAFWYAWSVMTRV